MNVRERVSGGQNVRVIPFAQEIGVPTSTVYAWIKKGRIKVVRFESSILIPADSARPFLNMNDAQPIEAA